MIKATNEASTNELEKRITDLIALVRQIVVGKVQVEPACGICSVMSHQEEECPTQQKSFQQTNGIGGFPG